MQRIERSDLLCASDIRRTIETGRVDWHDVKASPVDPQPLAEQLDIFRSEAKMAKRDLGLRQGHRTCRPVAILLHPPDHEFGTIFLDIPLDQRRGVEVSRNSINRLAAGAARQRSNGPPVPELALPVAQPFGLAER